MLTYRQLMEDIGRVKGEKAMNIVEIKAKKVLAGPGSFAMVAEAVADDGKYVTVQEYDGVEYTVADRSVYAFLANDTGDPVEEFLEEYTDAFEATKSAYADVFEALGRVLQELE